MINNGSERFIIMLNCLRHYKLTDGNNGYLGKRINCIVIHQTVEKHEALKMIGFGNLFHIYKLIIIYV